MEHIINTKAYKLLAARKEKANKEKDEHRKSAITNYFEKLAALEQYLDVRYDVIRSYYFKTYTEHGWIHTTRVLDYMYDIAEYPDALTDVELMLIIYTALLHDIGMAQTEEEGESLFSDDTIAHRVTNYLKNHPSVSEKDAKREVRTMLIRGKHGDIANDAVLSLPRYKSKNTTPFADLFVLPCGTATEYKIKTVGALCRSHMESVRQIGKARGDDHAFFFIAGLLRIADYLDMVSLRANEYYRSIHRVSGVSETHFDVNQIINSSIHPICLEPCNDECPNCASGLCAKRQKQICITINYPTDLTPDKKAKAMRIIEDYTDGLEKEIQAVLELFAEKRLNPQYHIRLLPHINSKRPPSDPFEGEMKTEKLTVDYNAIKTLFSSNQLYKSKLCGLRELMQNAYDACRDFGIRKKSDLIWHPKIIIEINRDEDTFSIHDNGVGMSEYIIREYFLNIGKSVYNCEPEYVYDDHYRHYIGHFGLGFFAAFMLSPQVTVETLHIDSKAQAKRIELDINSNFATLTDGSEFSQYGTKVSLSLATFQDALCKEFKTTIIKEDIHEFSNRVIEYISNTFISDGIEIAVNLNGKILTVPKLKDVYIKDGLILNNKLVSIEAVVDVPTRAIPSIFFAVSPDTIIKVNYDELLRYLSGEQREIPYLDAGNFLIFTTDNTILEDFQSKAISKAQRQRSLCGQNRTLSKSINIKLSEFFDKYRDEIISDAHPAKISTEMPTQCTYAVLTYLKDSREHTALCERNVPCASHRIAMLRNNACGTVPLDDHFYMRGVSLSDLHIMLPYINFRYSFDELVANIKTDGVYPTLPRDTLTDEHCIELGQAIGKALADLKNTDGDQLISDMLYGNLVNNTFYRKGKE